MKKLTISALSLFILLMFSHGAVSAGKFKEFEPKSKAVISLDQIHEDLPGPEKEVKKVAFLQSAVVLLTISGYLIITKSMINRISSFSAFLTAVFFQSNYVIGASLIFAK